MCKTPTPTEPLATLIPLAHDATANATALKIATSGSRRRRLWELAPHAHCPVVGVCLPMSAVRKITLRIGPQLAKSDDYELHSLAVNECRHRGALAEALQKELDQRHALAIRQAAKLKDAVALWAWWQTAVDGPRLGEALWVLLTHPRCDAAIEQKALGMVHMLQHQVGVACRVDQARFESLLNENAALGRHLADAQTRFTRQSRELGKRIDDLESALVRARADLLGRDTLIQQLRGEQALLQSASPDLPTRLRLQEAQQQLHEQMQRLRRQAQQSSEEADRQRHRAAAAEARLAQQPAPAVPATPALPGAPTKLDKQSVLCVGGRPGTVPIYRELVEDAGARFLHHDGGEEDKASQLDATLAAADVVICQTACISHNAYWRVKEHCKRHGKRCVFVDTPSQSALARALAHAADPS